MIGRTLFLAVVAAATLVQGFRQNYIMNVAPSCGSTTSDPTTITIRADMDISASALCKSGTNEAFTATENDVVHTATVSTTASGCQFYKKQNSEVYTINIEISYGEPGAYVHTQQESYLITCTYDENGENIAESASKTIGESYVQAMEIQHNMGSASGATFTLQTIDVLGNPITASTIAIGRKVQLEGILSGGTGSEPGVRAVSCLATSATSSYAVLRGGCGDGVVFAKTEGFTTIGKKVYSPYFGTFKLSDGNLLQFTCNFTVCTSNCDGSSCTNVRRKRSGKNKQYDGGESIQIVSQPLEIEEKSCFDVHEKKLPNGLIVIAPPKTETIEKSSLFMMVLIGIMIFLLVVGGLSFMYACIKRQNNMPSEEKPNAGKYNLKA